MRIPDGDLAPARRRRYGGSYGRRRRRNIRLVLATLFVLAAAGTAYGLLEDTTAPARLTQQPCPTPTPTPSSAPVAALPRPQQVRLALLNGTARDGLAKTVGDKLVAAGFVVTSQGNAPAALGGPSVVAFGPGTEPAATLVSRWVLGSRTVSDPRLPHGGVQVTLGSDFHRLATPAELAAAVSSPTPAPTATQPSCSA